MKLELKTERHNPHLKRKELMIEVDHEGAATPTTEALRQLVAKQFATNLENTEVRGIFTEGGIARSRAKIFVWNEKKVEEKMKGKEKEKESKKEENKEDAKK